MKISKNIIKVLFVGAAVFGTSCTANFEDMNKNPYEVTDGEMGRDGYNTRAALLAMQSWVVPTSINTCQFTDMLMAGSWGGYLADSNPSFNSGKFSSFNAPENWMKVMYQDIIPKMYANYNTLKTETRDPIPLAVAAIIKVAAIHRIADCYGPIPYSKLGEDGNLQAPLDSQQKAYEEMFKELDDAIEVLTARQSEALSANADKLYGGDLVKWVKLANSLKLRLAMRIVYADAATAKKKAEEAVDHPIGVMTSNGDNAAYSGFGKDGNPFAKVMYEYNNGDSRVSGDITAYMNGYKDPRRAAYFTVSTFTLEDDGVATNGYNGLRSGIRIPSIVIAQKYSNAIVNPSTPLQWMNASEVAFLCAEGALRGWNMGGSAESFYKEGVKRSFSQWNVPGADAYLTDSVNIPDAYKDPLTTFNYSGYTSNVTIAWKDAASFETNLERIITQKWIANFLLGHEAWAEYRRTGYPRLMPVVQNLSGGIVATAQGARRLSYPLDEYTTNGQNLNNAVASYLNGPDNMATRVWWDCKP